MRTGFSRKGIQTVFAIIATMLFVDNVVAQIVRGEGMDAGLGGGNSIVGSVYDSSGQKLSRRIQVRLTTMTAGDRISMTDDNGNFSFRGLVSGTYTVVIDKEKEYEPHSQSVGIIQFRGSPGGTYNLNIRLSPRAGADTRPGVLQSELANVPQPALLAYSKALELAKNKDYLGAIEHLQLSITEYPEFTLAYNEMGVAYLRINELQKADESFLAALKIEPDAYAPQMNRGIVLVSMKKFEDAETVLRKVVKLNDQSAVAHYFLGQAIANLGKFDEAEKELAFAVKTGGPEMKEAHRVLAIIYGARGDKKKAVKELETYLELNPTTPDAEQLKNVIKQLKGN
jgi:Flp pilus assembly protein TadD